MFEWKLEELKLKDSCHEVKKKGKGMTYLIFDCEKDVSREDKIQFVDAYTEGKLSYLLSLFGKFEEEKDTLKKDNRGCINTNSLIAWIKRNDTKYSRPVCSTSCNYGSFQILRCNRSIFSPNIAWTYDYYDDIVDECFRRCLCDRELEEEKYFREHDEYSILCEKIANRNHNTTFGVKLYCPNNTKVYICDKEDITKEREITLEELKDMVAKYEQLDVLVEEITKQTHIVY